MTYASKCFGEENAFMLTTDIKKLMQFSDAQLTCENRGGQLFEPKTQVLNEFARNFIKENGLTTKDSWVTVYYIGVIDYNHGGTGVSEFTFLDGNRTALLEASKGQYPWRHEGTSGQPDNVRGNEYCVVYFERSNSGGLGWDDEPCDIKHRFICVEPCQEHKESNLQDSLVLVAIIVF